MEGTVPNVLPKWTKPLDNVADCAERLDTDGYELDWDQRLQAVTFLADRKKDLPFDFEFAVPQGDHWLTRTNDPVWSRVIGLTEDRCGCGQHRVIVGEGKTSELASDDRITVVPVGKGLDLVPRGLHRRQTIMRLCVEGHGSETYLRLMNRPYTATINFAELFSAKGYQLGPLAEALVRQKEPGRLLSKDWLLAAILSANAAAKTVTIRPNAAFDANLVDA